VSTEERRGGGRPSPLSEIHKSYSKIMTFRGRGNDLNSNFGVIERYNLIRTYFE